MATEPIIVPDEVAVVSSNDVSAIVETNTIGQSPLEQFWESVNTNDFLVGISLFLLVVVASLGLAIFFSSPRAVYSNDDPLTHLMQAEQKNALQKHRRVKKKEKGKNSATDVGVIRKSKKKVDRAAVNEIKKNISEADHGHIDPIREANENSPLLSYDGDSDRNKTNSSPLTDDFANDDASDITSTASNSYEENLKKSLLALLRGGMTMTQHRGASKISKAIYLSINAKGNVLKWRSARLLARNSYELSLKNVQSIEWGKNTTNFMD